MKSRTITLVIFLLVFASATSAMPTEGTDYQDSEFFDELSAYATAAWNYVAPSLEPLADLLYKRAVSNHTSFDQIDGVPSTTTTVSVEAHRDISQAGQDCLFQLQAISQSSLGYPPPDGIHQEPYIYPQTSEIPSEDTSLQGLTAGIMAPLDAQSMAFSDVAMQNWIDSSYTPGQRVQPIPTFVASWPEMRLYPQFQLLRTTQPGPTQVVRPQSLEPVAGRQTMRPQNDSQSGHGRLICGHDGCSHTSLTNEGLRHHRRYHMPMELRPHPCPYCHQRFLCPREVERHLPTHGLGRHFYCNVSSCLYATKGFGRRDHLTRHVRSKHAADSVLQNTETSSSLGSTSAA